MFFPFVFCVSIMFIIGTTFAGEESKVSVKHLDPEKGTAGYDLYYYDGESLRDEKWRFDPKTGSTVVSRRNGFRDKDNFHLVDATLDALGSFSKSYKMRNEPDLIRVERVKEPQTNVDSDSKRNEGIKASNAFSGVSFNTQYTMQNGFPHVSNVVGIEQLNAPNLFNGLNFQQAFSTAGFGFQQHGSVFNHQTQLPSNPQTPFQNNHNFQLSTFLMPFFNQHNNNNNNNNHNQYQPFGSFPSFGNFGIEMGHQHATEGQPVGMSTIATTTQNTIKPIVNEKTTTTTPTTTTGPTTTRQTTTRQTTTRPTTTATTTTPDPTLNFDIRLEKDGPINETATQSTETVSRRPVEGLPTSDEDYADDGGILDDKINPKVLLSAVG